MKTDIGIWSEVRWKFSGVCARDPGSGVEYHCDVGVFEGWVIETRHWEMGKVEGCPQPNEDITSSPTSSLS